MKGRDFSLQPFPGAGSLPSCRLTGSIARRGNTLALRYELRGPLAHLAIPGPGDVASRRHGLWEETCFEFFLGVRQAPQYWEFNLSPAGHWNVYRFAGYRQGMAEETAFASLSLRVRRRPDLLSVALELKIDRIVAPDQPLEVGLAAVIKFRDHGLTYWALTHPGPQPDFHRRDGFLMEL